MKTIMKMLLTLLLLLYASLPALSQDSPTEDPAHAQLRALRDGMQDAIKKGDIERQVSYLHPNVVVTWQNAEVSRGRDGVRAYLNRMLTGPNKVVANFGADLNVDELTILYGGYTGISFGSSREHVGLVSGRSIDYNGRWSATLVKEDGKWLIASLHASTNLFDNPFLSIARRMMYVVGVVALIVGLALGLLLGRRRKGAT
jgi:ketosteroid isomerase-like protein